MDPRAPMKGGRGLRRLHCRICAGHVELVGALSKRGRCRRCGTERVIENVVGLHNRQGDAWERWRSGMIRLGQKLSQVDM